MNKLEQKINDQAYFMAVNWADGAGYDAFKDEFIERVYEITDQAVQEAIAEERKQYVGGIILQATIDEALAKQREELVEKIEALRGNYVDDETGLVLDDVIDLIKNSTKEEK